MADEPMKMPTSFVIPGAVILSGALVVYRVTWSLSHSIYKSMKVQGMLFRNQKKLNRRLKIVERKTLGLDYAKDQEPLELPEGEGDEDGRRDNR